MTATGNRVAKTVGGTTTYYLLDDRNPSGYVQVLEEWTSTGTPTLSRVYNYGYALISQRQPGVSTNSFCFRRPRLDAGARRHWRQCGQRFRVRCLGQSSLHPTQRRRRLIFTAASSSIPISISIISAREYF